MLEIIHPKPLTLSDCLNGISYSTEEDKLILLPSKRKKEVLGFMDKCNMPYDGICKRMQGELEYTKQKSIMTLNRSTGGKSTTDY